MNAPSLPHVPLPHVDVHDVSERVQDLAASAAERLEELPDKAVALAGAVIPALRPAPKRSKRPFLLIVLAVVAVVGVAWVLKSRRAASEPAFPASTAGPGEPTVSAAS